MSDPIDRPPAGQPPRDYDDPRPPRRQPPPPAPPPQARSPFFGCLFFLSVLLNLAAFGVVLLVCIGAAAGGLGEEGASAVEQYHSGTRGSNDKVAIVSIDGIIMEGLLGHVHKQIDTAAKDSKVKAVVLRVNSPGGSVTASEDLNQRITKLRDGDKDKNQPARPLVVSLGSVAASGGYYIAVPGKKIFAEKTTTTGSIGVYTSLPNATGLAEKYGFQMKTIKAGEIKDAGSAFKPLSPKEEQVIQDSINEAYLQFLAVIEKDRPKLTRALMLERFKVEPVNPDPHLPKKGEPYTRYRADGGTFPGPKAKDLGLVDAIGTLDDAVKAAADLAELDSYKAVKYQKPFSLPALFSAQTSTPGGKLLDPERLEAALSPRLWYLAPGYEAASFVAAGRAAK